MISLTAKKFLNLLEKYNLSQNELARRIYCNRGSFSLMLQGKKPFPEDKIQKIALVFEISTEEIKGWILADKYLKEVLQRALELKQEYAEQGELVFTSKIHELMKQHNLTINPFAKTIEYNQGWLSQVVLGKEPVSKKLMQKLLNFSNLSEEEITSWSVADKYSSDALQVALGC